MCDPDVGGHEVEPREAEAEGQKDFIARRAENIIRHAGDNHAEEMSGVREALKVLPGSFPR